MTDITSDVIPADNPKPNPEAPNNDDHTPSLNDERLELPIVPTQDEVDPPKPIDPPESIEAPYGYNKDGTPAKKRGRKGGSTTDQTPQFDRLDSVTQARPLNRAKSTEKATQPVVPSPQSIATDYRVMGETAANVWFNVGEAAFGEDWQPEPNEPQMIAGAFRDYFQAKEIKAIDPTIVLLIALGGYTVKRLNKPTLRNRLSGITQWLKSKIKR